MTDGVVGFGVAIPVVFLLERRVFGWLVEVSGGDEGGGGFEFVECGDGSLSFHQ